MFPMTDAAARQREECAIIKTLPGRFARGQLERFFGLDGKPCFHQYFFTLGRGQPRRRPLPNALYFTHCGRIIGHFEITEIVQNAGQLPKLTTLDGEPSEWQIKADAWVAVCDPPFVPMRDRIYFAGFRGFRYFDLETYKYTREAKVRL
jgi:hypothetical protein